MKRLFSTDEPYNLSPITFQWAFERYKKMRRRNWNPENTQMHNDILCFRTLRHIRKEMFLDVFAMLTTSDLVIQENIALRIYEMISPPEIKLFLSEQIGQEGLHSYTYEYIINFLSLNNVDIYTRYITRPYIAQKFEKAKYYANLLKSDNVLDKLIGLIFFYLGWEGIWFYHGFTPIFFLKRLGLMTGAAEQLEDIGVDETAHFQFGIDLINAIIEEYGMLKENQEIYKDELIERAQKAMIDIIDGHEIYIRAAVPNDEFVGYNADIDMAYTRFLANIRLSQIDIPKLDFDASICYNSIPWLDEIFTIRKEKNFFETRVLEYQTGANMGFDNFDDKKFNINELTSWSNK